MWRYNKWQFTSFGHTKDTGANFDTAFGPARMFVAAPYPELDGCERGFIHHPDLALPPHVAQNPLVRMLTEMASGLHGWIRVDTHSAPSAVKKEVTRQVERELNLVKGVKRTREIKAELKERVTDILECRAKTGEFRVKHVFEFLWRPEEGILLLSDSSTLAHHAANWLVSYKEAQSAHILDGECRSTAAVLALVGDKGAWSLATAPCAEEARPHGAELTTGLLGCEFLTWLYLSPTRKVQTALGEVGVLAMGSASLTGRQEDEYKGSSAYRAAGGLGLTELPDLRRGLALGRLINQMDVMLSVGAQGYAMSISAKEMAVTCRQTVGCTQPNMEGADPGVERESRKLSALCTDLFGAHMVLSVLFDAFCAFRTGDDWEPFARWAVAEVAKN